MWYFVCRVQSVGSPTSTHPRVVRCLLVKHTIVLALHVSTGITSGQLERIQGIPCASSSLRSVLHCTDMDSV